MSLYYLMAQLPSLDGISDAMPLPITEERFFELCDRFLGRRTRQSFDALTLIPPQDGERTAPGFLCAWNTGERQLRLALASVRASKLQKTPPTITEEIPAAIWQLARTAVQMEDPMEAERFLHQARLDFLETLRPSDPFSENAVFYYGLKLRLLARMRHFDEEKGKAAYRNLYDSILRGAEQEANEC